MQQETSLSLPKYKMLPHVRKLLLKEFELTPACLTKIDNLLGQEPHKMITNRNGDRTQSTRWSTGVEQIWAWNNVAPDNRGRYDFKASMSYKDHSFNRREIIVQPIFRADLTASLYEQIQSLGYNRVYVNLITRTDWKTKEEYQTLMFKVNVA